MAKLFDILTATVLLIFAIFIIGLLISYPFMLLWNLCLVPAVTVLAEVTWLQAYGILIACAFMFKSSTSTKSK